MSIESAKQFLMAVTTDEGLRQRFEHAPTPDDFLSMVQEMGYSFTMDHLKTVIEESSEGVEMRRATGVWKWLRQVNWVQR